MVLPKECHMAVLHFVQTVGLKQDCISGLRVNVLTVELLVMPYVVRESIPKKGMLDTQTWEMSLGCANMTYPVPHQPLCCSGAAEMGERES